MKPLCEVPWPSHVVKVSVLFQKLIERKSSPARTVQKKHFAANAKDSRPHCGVMPGLGRFLDPKKSALLL